METMMTAKESFTLPGAVAAAVQTLRPELLELAIQQARRGELSGEDVVEILRCMKAMVTEVHETRRHLGIVETEYKQIAKGVIGQLARLGALIGGPAATAIAEEDPT